MIETSQRIRIVGGPGSGKTYLANLISNHTNFSYVNLDDLYWSKGLKRNSDIRDSLLSGSLKSEQWIVEGSFDEPWVKSTFMDATMIIVLKPFFITRLCRVFRKYFSKLFSRDNISFRQFISQVKTTIAYNSVHLYPLLKNVHYKRRAIIFKRADAAYAYFVEETAPDLFM